MLPQPRLIVMREQRRIYVAGAITGLFIAANCVAAHASDLLPAPRQVSTHCYAWIGPYPGPSRENRGFRMNLGFVAGSDAVLVVDTGYTPEMARAMLDYIRRVTNAPVRYAVNTNSQPHRFLGNDVFRAAGATIIAHPAEAARMASDGAAMAAAAESILGVAAGGIPVPRPPDRTVSDSMVLDLGGINVLVRHLGAAHTPAPLVVSIPSDRVVFAGDILYAGRLPAVLPVSHVRQWLASFDALSAFGGFTFIPGHGSPGTLTEFSHSTRNYLALLDGHMASMVDQGVDLQQAIDRLDQSSFNDLAMFSELSGRNASLVYLEREREGF